MDKNLFFYELEGRGYTFHNKNWDEAKHGFEDDMLNMAWEMWSSGQAAKAQAVPEWISVKDQLPPSDPYNREYWVYETLNNKVQHDYWVCPDTGLDQDFEPFFNNWPREVTHWMPMVKYPKPPVQAQEPTND